MIRMSCRLVFNVSRSHIFFTSTRSPYFNIKPTTTTNIIQRPQTDHTNRQPHTIFWSRGVTRIIIMKEMKTLATGMSHVLSSACCYLLLLAIFGSTAPSVLGFSSSPAVHRRHGRDCVRDLTSSTPTTTALQLHQQQQSNDNEKEDMVVDDVDGLSRRRFVLNQMGSMVTVTVAALGVGNGVTFNPRPASAADKSDDEVVLPTKETVVETFAPIKFELNDPTGGVATMQGRIDEEDWDGLMEFTQTYDLELRKKLMGKAKKLLQSKDIKSTATTYANGVTFDLIGINRSSRKGQQSVESANKYLQELREDVTKFLSLESTIETLQQ